MGVTVRITESEADRQAALRLRYQVLVDEKGFHQTHADPASKTLPEPTDDQAVIYIALLGDTVVGSLTVLLHPCPFGFYTDLFQMGRFKPYYPERTAVTTKLVVAPEHRTGQAAFRMMAHAIRDGFDRGARFNFICSYPETLRIFRKLGFRQVHPQTIHPDYGRVIPLVLAWDPEHLASVHSPLLPVLMESPHAHERLPDLNRLIHEPERQLNNTPDPAPPTRATATTTAQPRADAPSPEQFTARLDARIDEHLHNVAEQTELCQLIADPQTDPALAVCLIRHTLVESFAFAPKLVEITFHAIGRLPFDLPKAMKQACLHILEEVDHGDMALRTYLALGGDEHWARSRPTTPATFAMIAACQRLVDRGPGAAYLGFMYPMEKMTPVFTDFAMRALEPRGIGTEKREFIDTHAVADIAHMRSIKNMIETIVRTHPDLAEPIEYAFDVFLALYPAHIWDTVVQRARAETAAGSPPPRAA